MLVSYNWLKDYVGETIPSPEEIEKLLTFHAFEIESVEKKEGDTLIDVDILPNRSSDCLCHRGIAREIATVTKVPLAYDPLRQDISLPSTTDISVEIEDAYACRRFTATVIEGIEVKESPQWLQDRLLAIGQRPINNIVDATNYVMYAIGQPLHAYDADKFPQVDGKWQFQVRFASPQENVHLIAEGGKQEDRVVELTGSELLIVDGSSNTPIGLAGVKGGRYASVDETTKKIIVEAANFDPILTRTTARGLGIVIDASKRFENEPSRELPLYAQKEVVELIIKIAGGICTGYTDQYPTKADVPVVTVSPKRVNALLGIEVPIDEMITILTHAGIEVHNENGSLICKGPWERTDLNIEEDFIEEIGRVYGYHHITAVMPTPVELTGINARHYYSEKIRKVLVELGFSEVITSSFRNVDTIQLQNSLASDKSYMRSSLSQNILEVLDKNAGLTDLLGAQDTRVFEIGTVFSKADGGINEHTSLSIGVRSKQSGYTGKEDAVLSKVLAMLEEKLGVPLSPRTTQGVAEINLSNVLSELSAPTSYEQVEVGEEITYRPFSLYPSISMDIAVWVGESTTAEEVEKVLNENTGSLRVRTTLFDTFTKEGRTSFAFRLVFQSASKTLTYEEVKSIMDSVNRAVVEKGWEVR